jgi:butyrate kinase
MAKLFILNLGSTSSKIALFEDETIISSQTFRHTSSELDVFPNVLSQTQFRKDVIDTWLKEQNVSLKDMDLIVVRGAVTKPIPGGIYLVDEAVYDDISHERNGSHISNVGICIGYQWGKETGKQVVFVNAPMTDEFHDLARVAGLKGMERRSGFHALNTKQIALEYAKSIHKPVTELNLLIAHIGGGISVGIHERGRVIDVSNALDGEGPFSPERAGGLTSRMVLQVIKENPNDPEKVAKLLVGKGGLVSHLGTSDVKEVYERSLTDPHAKLILDAMIYQIAKEIGAFSTVVCGKVDQILITGGVAYNTYLIEELKKRVAWIAPVSVYPGEDEMRALASGGCRYLRKEETLKSY